MSDQQAGDQQPEVLEEWATSAEAAAFLGVSRREVRRKGREAALPGKLRSGKWGPEWRFRWEDLRAYQSGEIVGGGRKPAEALRAQSAEGEEALARLDRHGEAMRNLAESLHGIGDLAAALTDNTQAQGAVVEGLRALGETLQENADLKRENAELRERLEGRAWWRRLRAYMTGR